MFVVGSEKLYSDRLELVGGPVFAARGSLRIFDCRKERTFLMVNPPPWPTNRKRKGISPVNLYSLFKLLRRKNYQVRTHFYQFYCFSFKGIYVIVILENQGV